MKNFGKTVFSFCVMLLMTHYSYSQEISLPFDYPVKPGTDEWKKFQTQDEMINACQIPDNVLKNLSTKALAETCLQYPLFPQINAYNNIQSGFDRLASKFNGFKALLDRPDSYAELFKIYKSMNPSGFAKDWSVLQRGRFIQKFQFIEMLLAQEAIISKLDLNTKNELLQETQEKFKIKLEYQGSYGVIGLSHTSYVMIRTLHSDSVNKALLDNDTSLQVFNNTAVVFDASVLEQVNNLVETFLNKGK